MTRPQPIQPIALDGKVIGSPIPFMINGSSLPSVANRKRPRKHYYIEIDDIG